MCDGGSKTVRDLDSDSAGGVSPTPVQLLSQLRSPNLALGKPPQLSPPEGPAGTPQTTSGSSPAWQPLVHQRPLCQAGPLGGAGLAQNDPRAGKQLQTPALPPPVPATPIPAAGVPAPVPCGPGVPPPRASVHVTGSWLPFRKRHEEVSLRGRERGRAPSVRHT